MKIELGQYYRLKSSPSYGWVKPIKILPPKTDGNANNFIVVKCEHTINRDDKVGMIKLFRLQSITTNKTIQEQP